MPLVRAGSLPVSAINIGLAASVAGLTAKAAKLQADVSKLVPALAGQVQCALDFPPSPSAYIGPIGAALNPLELGAIFNPATMSGASVDIQASGIIDLAAVTAQLAIVEKLQTMLSTGLDVPGVAGWVYSGPGVGLGASMGDFTVTGFGTTPADAQIQAMVVATESLAGWRAFSKSVETGGTANAPASPQAGRLTFLGELPGRRWNSGVAKLGADLDLLVADLRGTKSAIAAQAKVAIGVNLPEVGAVVGAGLNVMASIGIGGLLGNMVNVRADITGAIGGVLAKIDALVKLGADIAAQLSAGGLTLWTYAGSASGLGEALRSELAAGIPGGTGPRAPAYGLVLAGTPASMTSLGGILKTS